MKREEIRELINEYLKANNITEISDQCAIGVKSMLRGKYKDSEFGNKYEIECEYDDFWSEACITGNIKRLDPFEDDYVIDSVKFSIYENMDVMVWDKDEELSLCLDMDNLSKNDLIDIKHFNYRNTNDLYYMFIRVKSTNRGKLANMIDNCLGYFTDDIPSYAFYNYEGLFYDKSGKAIGDIGGGRGFGGIVMEQGTTAHIATTVKSIGEHSFDGCKYLTEVYLNSNIHYIGKHAFSNIPGLIIHCPFAVKPNNWDDLWCDSSCKVIWG